MKMREDIDTFNDIDTFKQDSLVYESVYLEIRMHIMPVFISML